LAQAVLLKTGGTRPPTIRTKETASIASRLCTMPMLPIGAALRLPDIRPPPSPSDRDKRLICQMHDVAEEARQRREGSAPTYKERTRSRPRVASFGLEDFLNDPPNRQTGSRCGPGIRRSSRPTQRQAIDDETAVPVEIFESMLRAGQQARGRATHSLAFSNPDGRPYLRHHDHDALTSGPCPMEVDEPAHPVASSSPPLVLPTRPPSSCASELAEGWITSHEGVAMQVG